MKSFTRVGVCESKINVNNYCLQKLGSAVRVISEKRMLSRYHFCESGICTMQATHTAPVFYNLHLCSAYRTPPSASSWRMRGCSFLSYLTSGNGINYVASASSMVSLRAIDDDGSGTSTIDNATSGLHCVNHSSSAQENSRYGIKFKVKTNACLELF